MSIPRIPAYALPTASALLPNKVSWPLRKERAALLIHDMQDYFIQFYGRDNALLEQVTTNMAAILAFCRAQAIPVFYTAQQAAQISQERALLSDMWGNGITGLTHLEGIVAELAPIGSEQVLVKHRYSAFQRSDLEAQLRAAKRDQLIICGIYANIGCLSTAVDAFMRDIQPFMVMDALADFSKQEHLNALHYTATKVGVVVDTKGVLSV
ncbi:MAG: isochorismatase family protein [Neisseriaceae bacterium]|nr:isochorismatase family protein [Neisseriaceae bacterium]